MPVHPSDSRHALWKPAVLIHDACKGPPRPAEVRLRAVATDGRVVDNVPERVIARTAGRSDVPVGNGLLTDDELGDTRREGLRGTLG